MPECARNKTRRVTSRVWNCHALPRNCMFTHKPHTVIQTTATLYPGTACLPTCRIQSYRQPPRCIPELHVYAHAAYSPTDNRHALPRNCMFTDMPHTVIQTSIPWILQLGYAGKQKCFFTFYGCIVPNEISPTGNSVCFPQGKPAATESRYPT